MFTQEEIKLGIVKAALTGKIKGYKNVLKNIGEDTFPELKMKYNGIVEELEEVLKIIEE